MSVAATTAVPLMNGDNETALAVAVVSPLSVTWLPDTVMMPAVVTLPDWTNLVGEKAQVPARLRAVDCELCTLSETAVRHDDAAKMTSETLARIV